MIKLCIASVEHESIAGIRKSCLIDAISCKNIHKIDGRNGKELVQLIRKPDISLPQSCIGNVQARIMSTLSQIAVMPSSNYPSYRSAMNISPLASSSRSSSSMSPRYL
ncbi:hypothetical protein BU24DRAFT_171776 [Aaosphaeria arxii CBS 175.79]|uniref:Uncharacterized protein n=1 Tax=Aaosphaeria arxii CBS 175.79 TaxID=1450172 RepID=A0A6A5XZ73_9PLEO|nr:uncharacterized protein BU24DRAFT_171776 [Aaosphaeria arxii CBS 175.79]KAF2018482.1 hypothetical protein BU24DRAFT_171776 [Aaosphaeria arxii CBS 175.79]